MLKLDFVVFKFVSLLRYFLKFCFEVKCCPSGVDDHTEFRFCITKYRYEFLDL